MPSSIPIFILLLFLMSSFCKPDDTLTHTKPLLSGDKLVSKGGDFALGFFSPPSSNTSTYLGIWYNNIPEHPVVWVTNRDNPIITTSSPSASTKLAITSEGCDMALFNSEGHTIWTTSSNITTGARGDAVRAYAVLLSSGNLVLRYPNGTYIWESFDHPTDTLLPSMKFLMSSKTRVVGRLVAWKGPDNPSSGDFSFSSDPSSPTLQFFIWHGVRPYCRTLVLNDATVASGAMSYLSNASSFVYQSSLHQGDEFYHVYTVMEGSLYVRVTLDYTGELRHLTWNGNTSSWIALTTTPTGCNVYGSCGPFGYCGFLGAVKTCRCLDEFEPEPGGLDFSRGCKRKQALSCRKQSHFVTVPGMKVPDKFVHVLNRSFDECAAECRRNCSCTAYAYANLSNEPMTALWPIRQGA